MICDSLEQDFAAELTVCATHLCRPDCSAAPRRPCRDCGRSIPWVRWRPRCRDCYAPVRRSRDFDRRIAAKLRRDRDDAMFHAELIERQRLRMAGKNPDEVDYEAVRRRARRMQAQEPGADTP